MGFLRRLFGRDIKTDAAVQNGYTLVADDTKTSGIDWSDVLVRGGLSRDLATGINNIDNSGYDIDQVATPGEYYFGENTSGTKPSTYGLLKVWREHIGRLYQLVHSADKTPNKMFSRYYSDGTWGPWTEYASISSIPSVPSVGVPSVRYTEGSPTPGAANVNDSITVKGRATIIAVSGGGGGGGGGGANAGAGPYYDGWPGTGGGAGVKAVLEYCPWDGEEYSIATIITPAGAGGAGGAADGGLPGENQQSGGDGEEGATIYIYIEDGSPIELQRGPIEIQGGRGGKGGYGAWATPNGSRTVPGSGVGDSLVEEYGDYLEVGASIPLTTGRLTLVSLSTAGSDSITTEPLNDAPLPGGEGVGPDTHGYSRPGISGGAAGTPWIPGGAGSTPASTNQIGFGGGGGGAGASGAGGTAGGAGGNGSKGCVTIYYT